MSSRKFYYWRELLFLLLMLTILLLDLTFFEVLSPFGDEVTTTGGASLTNK